MGNTYDVIIIGAGPAGLSAGLYTSRARLSTLLLEQKTPGGQVMNVERVENYPGLANVTGTELGSSMLKQAREYGAKLAMAEATGVAVAPEQIAVRTSAGDYRCSALIIASGAHPKKLNVPGEEEFANKGVFYCATCDGAHFANKVVAVAGGGDSAITEALNLCRIASEVVIIEIMPALTATSVLQDRAHANPKIEVLCGVKIEAILGDERVKSLQLLDTETQQRGTLDIDGILVHVGRMPSTDYLKGVVPLDKNGFILVNDWMETEVPGIFAAGDVRHNSAMQIVSACGDGAVAAISVCKKLRAG